MLNFEVSFDYLDHSYTATIIRDSPVPDILSINEPNNLRLPNLFTFDSSKLDGSPLLKDHPGLAEALKAALAHFCEGHPYLCGSVQLTRSPGGAFRSGKLDKRQGILKTR